MQSLNQSNGNLVIRTRWVSYLLDRWPLACQLHPEIVVRYRPGCWDWSSCQRGSRAHADRHTSHQPDQVKGIISNYTIVKRCSYKTERRITCYEYRYIQYTVVVISPPCPLVQKSYESLFFRSKKL